MQTYINSGTLVRIILNLVIIILPFGPMAQTHAELTFYSQKTKVVNTSVYSNYTYEITVFSKFGSDYGMVSIPFSPIRSITKIKAWIENANGEVIQELNKKDIINKNQLSNSTFYSDYMRKEFTLVHSTYPYTIHYEYSCKQSDYIDLLSFFPYLDPSISTKHAEVSLTVPKDISITTWANAVELSDSIVEEHSKTYKWETSYNAIKTSPNVPSPYLTRPFLRVSGTEFHYETMGSLGTWQQFGEWMHTIIKPKNDLPDAEQLKVKELTAELSDTISKIKTLYHYLQDETTYVNISTETGGLVPYPASYVVRNKYGDCKALTNYFLSMLDCIGIKGYYCTIMAGKSVPSHNDKYVGHQSNHVIAQIPLGNDTLWLDCTSKDSFSKVSSFIQNRTVFVIQKGASYLTKTPALKAKDVAEIRNVSFAYGELDGEVSIHYKKQLRAESFGLLRTIDRYVSDEKKQELLKKYFLDRRIETDEIKYSPWHRDSTSTTLSYNGVCNRAMVRYGNDILCTAIPVELPYKTNRPEDRIGDYLISYPFGLSDTTTFVIPKGMVPSSIPENRSIENKFGSYHLKIDKTLKHIKLISSVSINAGVYTEEEYPTLYDFMLVIQNCEKNKKVLISKQLVDSKSKE